jgi:hypothetical protein
MKTDNPVFLMTMGVVSIFGMLFATIAYNIQDNSSILRMNLEKGYQECIIMHPNGKWVEHVWQKECQDINIKGDKNGD